MRYSKIAALCLEIFALGATQIGHAAEADPWQFEITPYILTAGLDGTVGLRSVTSDLDMSISDVLNDLEVGLMGLVTARKGPWMYGLEGVYFKLEDQGANTVTGPFGNVSVSGALQLTTEMSVYQGTVGYRVLDGSTSVDLIGGVRYTKLDVDMSVTISTTPGIVFPGGTKNASGSEGWTDGVVGAMIQHRVSDNVSLLGYADVGGGGSDLTYQMIAGVNWEFNQGYTAKLGYRLLDWDYEEDGTVWDITASGPYVGLGIRF